MFNFLGSIIKIALKPVGWMIADVLYDILIGFPLKCLNYIYTAFLWLSGKGTDKLLFQTSISDGGKVHLNFFAHPSPLQYLYISVMAIALGTGALWIGLAVIKSHISKNDKPHAALGGVGRALGGGFLTAALPLVVMTTLGVIGAVSSVFISGKNIAPQTSDITQAQTILRNRVNDLKNFNAATSNLTQPVDEIYMFSPQQDPTDPKKYSTSITRHNSFNDLKTWPANITPTVNDNLDKFIAAVSPKTDPAFKTPSWLSYYDKTLDTIIQNVSDGSTSPLDTQLTDQNLKQQVQGLKDQLFNIKTDGIIKGNGDLGDTVKDNIKKLITLIGQTQAKVDQKISDELLNIGGVLQKEITELNDFLLANETFVSSFASEYEITGLNDIFQNAADNNISASKSVGLYKVTSAIYNLKQVILPKLGLDMTYAEKVNITDRVPIPTQLTNFNEILAQLGIIMFGDASTKMSGNKPLSVLGLGEKLSTFETSSIVIAMYHLASGNSDDNWTNKPSHVDAARFLIAMLSIAAALWFMIGICIFAAKRIFEIGGLFIIAPLLVASSTVDEGKRLRQWLEIFSAKVFAILGVLIAARVFDVVFMQFQTVIESKNSDYDIRQMFTMGDGSSTGSLYLFKTILLALIAIGGLYSLQHSTTLISNLFGVGAGLEAISGMSAQALRAMKSSTKAFGGASKFAGGAVAGSLATASKYNFATAGGRGRIADKAQTVISGATLAERRNSTSNALAARAVKRAEIARERALGTTNDAQRVKYTSQEQKQRNKWEKYASSAAKSQKSADAARDAKERLNNYESIKSSKKKRKF